MKRMRTLQAALATAIAAAAASVPADEPLLVSVAIPNVTEEIAARIGVDSSQIPLNVQVPLDVAAGVCDVAAATLARQADSGVAQCTAQRSSPGLDDVVQKRVQNNAGR